MDRAIGIVLGLIIGLAIVIAFVFLGGEVIDSPSLEGGATEAQQERASPDPGGRE